VSAAPEIVAVEISKIRVGVTTRLTLRNTLSKESERAELANVVGHCLRSGENRIVIDLSHVASLLSAALELLVALQEDLLRAGGWLKLSNANALIQEISRVTGLSQQIALINSDGNDSRVEGTPYPTESRQRLGEILVARGLLDQARVDEALELQKKQGRQLAQILIANGWVSEQDVLKSLAEQLAVPYVRLRPGLFDPAVVQLLNRDVARRLKVMPLFLVRGVLTVATAQPQAIPILREVEEATGCKVRPVLGLADDILQTLNAAERFGDVSQELLNDVGEDFELIESNVPQDEQYAEIDQVAAGSPVINLVNSLIHRAVRDGASDIHIEPFRKIARVRLRIDGVLYEIMTPPIQLHPAIVSRLKVMANLDIAERRLPQDGRLQVQTQGRAVDLRFSSLPGLFGEKVVLRVLDKSHAILDVDKLGMSENNLSTYKRLLERGYGLILVTGPTGSGKTTSLYAALNHLNSLEKSIVTIEDPVEYQMDVINQNEVREKVGLTFAKVLKHVLRQDPDIVMVGEIRERETAAIAVQAALTGHLVVSTLHTNDSIGAITRLIDMGVEPYLLSSALIGVLAQRLLRTICQECKTTYVAEPEVVARCGWPTDKPIRLARGRGCRTCYDSGYRGRMAIHEALETDADLQRLIVSNPRRDELDEFLRGRGVRTLASDGLDRVREQLTTLEEVGRVVSS
jgi:type IV pilus assembly protein PilB